ncbi:hypothetical protein WCX72_07820 [Sulfurimonas sp. HSL1-6]|uniref:hypothetical protein n=1 Tax=Thiomicrolovo immobilis TaxID=3131935 RepID=UPI0031F7C9CD
MSVSIFFLSLCFANDSDLVINGYLLPPEPDPKVNNATLLGVDANSNGVRDDVERKIYFTYHRPIDQAYMMQFAKNFQKRLINPEQSAVSEETQNAYWTQYSCRGYLHFFKNIRVPRDSVDFMENNYINTRDRMRAYMKFNAASSGRNYPIPVQDDELKAENCDFNITLMLEKEKQGGK